MKGLSIIIVLIIGNYLINALNLEIKNESGNNYKILKDFPVKENDFFIFQYNFNDGSADLNDFQDLIFTVHQKDKPIENFIFISDKNSEIRYNNNEAYMKLHNYERTGSSLTLDLEFNYFADGMELSIYYFEIGNIDNRKTFLMNADKFQSNKILTKSIKILKMKDPEHSGVAPVDGINNKGKVWTPLLMWSLVSAFVILPIIFIFSIILHCSGIKILSNKNATSKIDETQLKDVTAVDNKVKLYCRPYEGNTIDDDKIPNKIPIVQRFINLERDENGLICFTFENEFTYYLKEDNNKKVFVINHNNEKMYLNRDSQNRYFFENINYESVFINYEDFLM